MGKGVINMNIVPVDATAGSDISSGSKKTPTEGTDSFSILMAALAAGNLIQQINNDATAAKGAVPELTGTAASASIPPASQLSGQITEVKSSIVNSMKDGNGTFDLQASQVSEDGEGQKLLSMMSAAKAADSELVGKKGLEAATGEVSAKEESATDLPETSDPFAFLNKPSKGTEAGEEEGSHELKGPQFKLLQQDLKEIASIKADAASEGVQVFNQRPLEMVVTWAASADGKGPEVHSAPEPSALVEQVSVGFKSVFKSGNGEVRMELHPESLGHLKIEVKVEGGVVRANIMAENSMVKDTIDSNLPMLRKSLEDQGLRIDQLSVGIDQRHGGSAFAEREQFQMWQSFDGMGTRYHEEEPLREPLYHVDVLQNEGVSIFA